MNNYISRVCPSCGSTLDLENDYVKPKFDASENYELAKERFVGFSEENVFFRYSRCKCGFLYAKKYFSLDQLGELYGSMPDNVHSGDYKSEKRTKLHYLNFILDHIPYNARIIEIGADNGAFAEEILEKKPNIDFTFVEPNIEMHNKLKNFTKNKIHTDISTIKDNENNKFDFVIGIHVFDHIVNISEVMKKISTVLKKDGKLFGVVHDESSILASILGSRWPAFCLQHPQLYNHKSINDFLESNNFKKVFIRPTKNFFPLFYLFGHALRVILKKKNNLKGGWQLPLNLGNFCFLYKNIRN